MIHQFLRMLVLAVTMGQCVSCGITGRRSPSSVLLITIDTLRPDRLSCYGYAERTTSAIDVVAAEGVLFEQAVCDIPWTTGSMASVMTGTFRTQHGVRMTNDRLPSSRTTLATVLKRVGYQTGAVVGSFPLASVYGLNQGFGTYDDEFSRSFVAGLDEIQGAVEKVPPPADLDDKAAAAKWADAKMHNDAYRSDSEVSARAIEWLKAHRDAPVFLWVHYFGPHERLVPNLRVSKQEQRMIADYDGDLQETDAAVGRLLAAVKDLGLSDNLLVVLHADHGQSLGEHGFVGHGADLYDASIRIPLMIRFPGRVVAGTRVPHLVRNVDIMPTILDMIGVPIPPGLNGRSLSPAIAGKMLPLPAYSETYTPTVVLRPLWVPRVGVVLAPAARYAIRTDRWKFGESQLAQPCEKGTSPYRGAPVGTDRWGLRHATPLPPALCDRLRIDELYDLSVDPREVKNVAPKYPDVVEQMRRLLHAVADQKPQTETIALSPAEKQRLTSLGYRSDEGSGQGDGP